MRGFLVCLSALVGSLWACAHWFGRTALAGLCGVPFGTCGSFGGHAPTGLEGRPLRGLVVCLSALVGRLVGMRPLVWKDGPCGAWWCAFRHLWVVWWACAHWFGRTPLAGLFGVPFGTCGQFVGLRPLVWEDAPCGALWSAFRHLWVVWWACAHWFGRTPLAGLLGICKSDCGCVSEQKCRHKCRRARTSGNADASRCGRYKQIYWSAVQREPKPHCGGARQIFFFGRNLGMTFNLAGAARSVKSKQALNGTLWNGGCQIGS